MNTQSWRPGINSSVESAKTQSLSSPDTSQHRPTLSTQHCTQHPTQVQLSNSTTLTQHSTSTPTTANMLDAQEMVPRPFPLIPSPSHNDNDDKSLTLQLSETPLERQDLRDLLAPRVPRGVHVRPRAPRAGHRLRQLPVDRVPGRRRSPRRRGPSADGARLGPRHAARGRAGARCGRQRQASPAARSRGLGRRQLVRRLPRPAADPRDLLCRELRQLGLGL